MNSSKIIYSELKDSGPFLHLIHSEKQENIQEYIEKRQCAIIKNNYELMTVRYCQNQFQLTSLLEIACTNRIESLVIFHITSIEEIELLLLALTYGPYVILTGEKQILKEAQETVFTQKKEVPIRWSTINSE